MKLTLIRLSILTALCMFPGVRVLADGTAGSLTTTDLPVEVQKGNQFDFEVGLMPASADFKDAVQVFMQQNPNVDFDPRSFVLTPGQTKKVTATVRKSLSGMAVIYASASNWQPIDRTVVVSGSGLRLNVNIEQPIEARRSRIFSVAFVDESGNPVSLEAGASLTLETSQGSNLLFYSEQQHEWTNEITTLLEKGDEETRPLQLKATSWVADTGLIKLNLKTRQDYKVKTATVAMQIVPSWWVLMFMGVLGGLLYSVVQSLRGVLQSKRKHAMNWHKQAGLAILLGVVPGALAYFFAAWNLLGIRGDTTGLRGFFVLGFLFAYVGLDVVLKLIPVRKT